MKSQLVIGTVGMVEEAYSFPYANDGFITSTHLIVTPQSLTHWLLALGFSVGLDTLTTGMITGRLIYHHKTQLKLSGGRPSPYLPVVTIFIESAALSLISKILQLSIPSHIIVTNPIVIPLCVSKQFITHVIQIECLGLLISDYRPDHFLEPHHPPKSTWSRCIQQPTKRNRTTPNDPVPEPTLSIAFGELMGRSRDACRSRCRRWQPRGQREHGYRQRQFSQHPFRTEIMDCGGRFLKQETGNGID
jgi:hypothetical protein